MALLARTADRLYWAARYLERAEDTARIIRTYHELVVDLGAEQMSRWEPLAALLGASVSTAEDDRDDDDDGGETSVTRLLISDRSNPSSIVQAVDHCRENLRTTRELMPREAWQVVNSLSQYVGRNCQAGADRQLRDRFLARVIDESRRFDGVIESTMSRHHEYSLLRLGRVLERADMTTRILGVQAAALLQGASVAGGSTTDVSWMAVLKSVSALQMYQRSTKRAISGKGVVRFLLFNDQFPRSVVSCLNELRTTFENLPHPASCLHELDVADAALRRTTPIASDAVALDQAMDDIQDALAAIDQAIYRSYVTVETTVSDGALR